MEQPSLNTKEVSLAQIVEALRKNGLPQITGNFFQYEDHFCDSYHETKKVIGACALGQVAINLGINPETIVDDFEFYVEMNDDGKPYDAIADSIESDSWETPLDQIKWKIPTLHGTEQHIGYSRDQREQP